MSASPFSRSAVIVAQVLIWALTSARVINAQAQTVAIVGATVIDGTGRAPLRDATIVVKDKRIVAIGPRPGTPIPQGALVIDAAQKFITPGFIDVNVHVTGQGFMKELFPLLLYGEQDPFMKYGYALEAAQVALKFGVTTIRDTFGPLPPLLALRDAIARGDVIGPRMQVAGEILGWSGGAGCNGTAPIDRSWCDYFRGYVPVGVELTLMYPDSVRTVLNQYLDLGVDFIKYGATTEGPCCPSYITFSPRVQRAIVEEAHKRGKKVDVHSSNAEGHLMAAEAGVDLITHTGLLAQDLSDDIVQVLRDRGVICGLFTSWTTGPMWKLFKKPPAAADASEAALLAETRKQVWPLRQMGLGSRLPKPTGVFRPGMGGGFTFSVDTWRRNDAKLIKGKCTVAVGTDSAPTPWPELTGSGAEAAAYVNPERPFYPDPGIGTILAIEGLVELGMSPSDAIVAGTRNGARATGLADLGTLEVGKLADLLILGADPLADISNIRKLERVMKEGQVIEPDSLPTRPRYYRR